jgi:hypothetical protein
VLFYCKESEEIAMCKHEVEHLIGTKDGIECRLCGKQFKTFAELEADRGEKKPEEVAEEKEIDEIIAEEEQAEEKPVAEEKPKKKATAKKGAKK